MSVQAVCPHLDFEARVDVGRIHDSQSGELTQFIADVVVCCKDCGESFGFRGPCAGHSWHEPRCSVDALKISLPLMAPSELALAGPLPAMGRGPMVYEAHPTEAHVDDPSGV